MRSRTSDINDTEKLEDFCRSLGGFCVAWFTRRVFVASSLGKRFAFWRHYELACLSFCMVLKKDEDYVRYHRKFEKVNLA